MCGHFLSFASSSLTLFIKTIGLWRRLMCCFTTDIYLYTDPNGSITYFSFLLRILPSSANLPPLYITYFSFLLRILPSSPKLPPLNYLKLFKSSICFSWAVHALYWNRVCYDTIVKAQTLSMSKVPNCDVHLHKRALTVVY